MNARRMAISAIFAAAAVAQSTATIGGRVLSNEDGLSLSEAPIQVKHSQMGAVFSARSAGDGSYILSGLLAGSYEISASYPGLVPYRLPDVSFGAGETRRLDI
jgi:hypothetical protein